ncbi:MAG: hypothetical protein IT377_09480 [Polyangiaceae bacterium]|nr:hypothetical protein [Polyangiaceae bacterium]
MTRTTLTRIAAVVVAFGVVFAIFGVPRTEQKAARAAFEVMARTLEARPGESPEAREGRLRHELGNLVEPDVQVTLPGPVELRGREAVVSKAVELSRGRRPSFTFREIRSGKTGRRMVRLAFEVGVSDSQAGDLHAAAREGTAELALGASGYRLHWLEIGAELRAEPEPRP